MKRQFKSYEELEFTDDFMFAAVMESDKEVCRQVIELILGRKIKDISYPDYQHSIIIRYDSRGVRLDVTVTDADGTVFDLEMQAVREAELPKRCRYYHGMLSLEQVEKGEGYGNLKETYVVFILKNGLGKDMRKPVYMFENYCKEEGLFLNDGAKTVFLNAACDTEGLSDELKAFVEYIKTGECVTDDSLVNAIDRSVIEVRENVKWRSEYMKFELMLMEARKEEREKALAEGKAKLAENYASLVKDGILTLPDAIKRSELSEEDFKKYLEP